MNRVVASLVTAASGALILARSMLRRRKCPACPVSLKVGAKECWHCGQPVDSESA
jgi:hypothetical protein